MTKRNRDFSNARRALRSIFFGRATGQQLVERTNRAARTAKTDEDIALMWAALVWLSIAKIVSEDRLRGGPRVVPEEAEDVRLALRWALLEPAHELLDMRLQELDDAAARLPDGILDRWIAEYHARRAAN